MTTIAYRAGVMAADTGIVCANNEILFCRTRKIERGKRGLTAACGDSGACKRWGELFRSARPLTSQALLACGEFEAIWVEPNGDIHWVYGEEGWVEDAEAEYAAIGSGSLLAMGALACGASAADAVLAASKHDIYTHEPITTESLKAPKNGNGKRTATR